jgi:NDP-sugar pyrophosphorylase family protein
MNQQFDIIILAGGQGNRLKSITGAHPKVLTNINGYPFIYYIFDLLLQQGINQIILCAGYLANEIINKIGYKYKEINIIYSVEETPLGTAGAIKNAENLLHQQNVCIINGDTICDSDINKIFQNHQKNKSKLTIMITQNTNDNNAASIELNDKLQIISYQEKINTHKKYASSGLYIVNKQLINSLPEGNSSLEYDVIPAWIKIYPCFGYINVKPFIDIGTPESYNKFRNEIEKW